MEIVRWASENHPLVSEKKTRGRPDARMAVSHAIQCAASFSFFSIFSTFGRMTAWQYPAEDFWL